SLMLPTAAPAGPGVAAEPAGGISVTYVGHATVLVRLDGATLLTDPRLLLAARPPEAAGRARRRARGAPPTRRRPRVARAHGPPRRAHPSPAPEARDGRRGGQEPLRPRRGRRLRRGDRARVGRLDHREGRPHHGA